MKILNTALILFLLFLSACESPANLKIKSEPTLVVSTVLVPGVDSTAVHLSLTKHGESDAPWAIITQAEVKLWENGAEVATAMEENGKYHFDYSIKPATTYKVSVDHPLHGYAWGETTVPSLFLQASIDTTGGLVTNRWLDNPDEQNFYWISNCSPVAEYIYDEEENKGIYIPIYDRLRLADYIYTTSPIIDNFNYTFDHSADVKTSYLHFLRIEDSGHSGKQIEIPYEGRISPKSTLILFILSMDKNYDAYMKSIIINDDQQLSNQDFPLFYKPGYIHSNIHGGVGIVGSYVRFLRYFNYPEEYYSATLKISSGRVAD